MSKRQFTGTSEPREHFDRKVQRPGHTVALSMGKMIPHDWAYVRLEKIKETDEFVIVKVTKLMEVNGDA